jgi:hypothetical protein
MIILLARNFITAQENCKILVSNKRYSEAHLQVKACKILVSNKRYSEAHLQVKAIKAYMRP